MPDLARALSLDEIRNRPWLPDRMGAAAYSQSDDAARYVPVLLAALDAATADRDALREALARHMQWTMSGSGKKLCAGCLGDWPCPDRGLLNGGGEDER